MAVANRVAQLVLVPGDSDEDAFELSPRHAADDGGGEPGDALITVKFERHKSFRREGHDLRIDLPITLYEAVLGAKVRVPTLEGSADLALKPNTDTSKALRLKGKGLAAKAGLGDLFATVRIVLPESLDPELEALMRRWRDEKPYNPRPE